MSDLIEQITADFQKQIDSFEPELEIRDVGTVVEDGDGIARATGLSDVRSQELVQFENGVIGIAFNLERTDVGIIIMGEYSGVRQGMMVRSIGRIASVPVGNGLIGSRRVRAVRGGYVLRGRLGSSRGLPRRHVGPRRGPQHELRRPHQLRRRRIRGSGGQRDARPKL